MLGCIPQIGSVTCEQSVEWVVFLHIVEYMETNAVFHPNHHGFRSLHSTTTAMIQMYDSWVEAMDKGEMAGVALIDQSAAFDCVDMVS